MFEKLINWSRNQHQNLPWRINRTLYGTLVSEIMLQQTTVQTVLNHFERFIDRFPSIESLASATEEELTIQWKGLGYYRRARNLKKACITIYQEYNGKIPLDFEKLIKISGIGEYTANAILAIGNNQRALAIDANLERVISRIYNIHVEKGPKLNKEIQLFFQQDKICKDIEKIGPRIFNEALMDLGRNFCKANRVYCEVCPVNENCQSYKMGEPLSLPKILNNKLEKTFYDLKLLRIIVEDKNERILTYVKKEDQWLSGQRELPTFIVETEDEKLNQYPRIIFDPNYLMLPQVKTTITKYKITNYILILNKDEFESLSTLKEYSFKEFLNSSNLSTASTKCLEMMNYKKQEKR